MVKTTFTEINQMAKGLHGKSSCTSTIAALVTFLVAKPWVLGSVRLVDNLVDFGVFILAVYYLIGIIRHDFKITPATLSLLCFIVYHFIIVLIMTPAEIISEISAWSRALVGFGVIYELLQLDYLKTMDGMGKSSAALLILDIFSGFFYILFGSEDLKIFSLLGTDVYSIFTIVPLLAIVIVDAKLNGGSKRRRAAILLFACTLQKMITGAATAEVALLVAIALLLLIKIQPRIARITLNPLNGFVLLALCTIVFAVFRATEAFAPLFEILGKDPSMSSRTLIWEAAVPEILDNIMFGHGVMEPIEFVSLMGFNPWDLYFGHCHNMVLEILFRDGIVGFVLISLFLISVFYPSGTKRIWSKAMTRCCASRVIILPFLFASCILWITDGYTSASSIFMMFGIYLGLAGPSDSLDAVDRIGGVTLAEDKNV